MLEALGQDQIVYDDPDFGEHPTPNNHQAVGFKFAGSQHALQQCSLLVAPTMGRQQQQQPFELTGDLAPNNRIAHKAFNTFNPNLGEGCSRLD